LKRFGALNTVKKYYTACFCLLFLISGSRAQDSAAGKNAWGVDVLISTNGFGLGTFYRHEYTDNLSGFVDFSISEATDDREISYVDYWTGITYVPGKINRFLLLPVFIGAQYRLFKDDIMDNFRPYINASVGPTMIYVFPYNEEYISALGKGRLKYTVGGYIGFGAYFGTERSSLLGLNVRYYFIPYAGGIESMYNTRKNQFGGLYLSLSFGSAW
jgi:outer membrane protein W